MTYRTKTYIAGDWDGDKNAIKKIYEWKESDWRTLDFVDAHKYTQARDGSLNCSIKQSLKTRLDVSKTFVLVVGDKTKTVTAGGCQHCYNYKKYISFARCLRDYSVDYRSYIEYECEQAVKAGIKIVVIYNSFRVDRNKCPDVLHSIGEHLPMYYKRDNTTYWNYNAIKNAICD